MHILKILTERRITGNIGEDAACKYLRKNKYKILKRNYVSGGHEIDIIAENREFICFVEVKTRDVDAISPKEPRPASAVTPKKQRAIITAAKGYLATHRPEKHVRFDIIEVYMTANERGRRTFELKHLENAFNRNTAYKPKFLS